MSSGSSPTKTCGFPGPWGPCELGPNHPGERHMVSVGLFYTPTSVEIRQFPRIVESARGGVYVVPMGEALGPVLFGSMLAGQAAPVPVAPAPTERLVETDAEDHIPRERVTFNFIKYNAGIGVVHDKRVANSMKLSDLFREVLGEVMVGDRGHRESLEPADWDWLLNDQLPSFKWMTTWTWKQLKEALYRTSILSADQPIYFCVRRKVGHGG